MFFYLLMSRKLCIMRGQYNSPNWELSEGIVQRAIIPGENCPGINCPRWQLSRGQLSGLVIAVISKKSDDVCLLLHSFLFDLPIRIQNWYYFNGFLFLTDLYERNLHLRLF